MSRPSPEVVAIRRRLRDDYSFYASKVLKIRTKAAEIRPFVFNNAQNLLDAAVRKQTEAGLPIRIVILKARQQGLSTYVEGRLYFRTSQATARRAVVVAHKADSTNALFNMAKRFHENVPPDLKPSTSYSSKKELVFDRLDSSYLVATAGGDSIARGETITDAHLSELAFWPEASAKENLNGLLQSIPELPGTSVFMESTANGVTGPFYEFWQGAVAGTNGYIPVFIPWFIDPSYAKSCPTVLDRTPEELELAAYALGDWNLVLTDDQLYWRRVKINQNGYDLFRQEYPARPEDAFLTTGRPVFDVEVLVKRKEACIGPIQRMGHILGNFEPHPVGELLLYKEIDPGETYYIGADVAMGVRDGDYSVAQVLDSRKDQVAVWRGRVHPDYYADVLNSLGTLYNFARIGVESNNHGLLTVTRLYKDLHYPNVFTEQIEGKYDDLDTPNLGFRTTTKTKPLIIDGLRASLRKGELTLNDKTTINEMLTYVVKESGKTEAEDGCHDDCVMSLAIADYIHDGVWKPIAVTDDFFITAI